jgi:holliday junction DNA helicase RuvB
VSDYCLVEKKKMIDREFSDYALRKLEVDEMGLDAMDRKVMQVIIEHYNGGPVGISAIAAAVSEEAETIEDVYEPYLLQNGFLRRGPRGRMASKLAYEHLGYKYQQKDEEGELF